MSKSCSTTGGDVTMNAGTGSTSLGGKVTMSSGVGSADEELWAWKRRTLGPTAIAPHSGAATGSGGQIRDKGATGRGSKPKAGLSGFTVSNLLLPSYPRHWEVKSLEYGKPD
uniref:Uncharacterized protein n=1 Tax=Pseudictyota dubia TaxID=2749911 RepID=A0A7R9VJC7_9STRA|mmetsp:Transcript_14678/g.28083  ORF Transcript_14678/g.28083 Transcript_14678/m.28083 type:complete len:112 (+) Transcript_14678:2-337(+)